MNHQAALPVDVRPEEVMRKASLGAAIELCAELGGFGAAKQLQATLGVDKGQFSRWISGDEGIKWPKLKRLMVACGNEVPVLWMAHDCEFDIHSLHKRESEVERQNRLLREENAALKRVLLGGAGA